MHKRIKGVKAKTKATWHSRVNLLVCALDCDTSLYTQWFFGIHSRMECINVHKWMNEWMNVATEDVVVKQ